jgi:hypothetical protein
MKNMRFIELYVLIDCEGKLLTIMQSVENGDELDGRLYIRALLKKPSRSIYAKLNDAALTMFFQNRLSIRDLFLLRCDEPYVICYKNEYQLQYFNDKEPERIIGSIHCGELHYYSFANDSLPNNPQDVLIGIRNQYINGLIYLPPIE